MNEVLLNYCSNCSAQLEDDAIYCANCGFPERGSEEQKQAFYREKRKSGRKSADQRGKIRIAKYTLFAVAGITFIGGLFVYAVSKDKDIVSFLINIIISLLYLGLGFWTNRKPFAAILTGFIIYLSINIINGFVAPDLIMRGIFIKVIIIIAFIKGISAARQAQTLQDNSVQ